MARLKASNGYYGHSSNNNYTNSGVNHLYVGKSSGTSNYRSRITFPSLRVQEKIGDSRIAITKMVLYLYRNDGGPNTVTAGASASSTWDATRSGTGSKKIAASTGWHSIDLIACADAVAGYTGNWYIHLTGNADHRIRFDGTGSANKPYLEVAWEYVAATIKSDAESVELGTPFTLTITPEVEGETHTLTYSIGEAEGVIGENLGDIIPVSLPPALAAEIPNDSSGTVDIHMTAYGPDGTVLRTERFPQTVTVPASAAPIVAEENVSLLNGLSGYGLTGKSSIALAPVINMNEAFGSLPETVTATIVNGESEQTITWTEFSETDAGVFACEQKQSAILTEPGSVRIAVLATDSRGTQSLVTRPRDITVCAYAPPNIETFAVERCSRVITEDEEAGGFVADDLGGYVWVNASASVSEVAPNGEQLNVLTWRIDAVNPATRIESEPVGGTAGQKLTLEYNREVFPDPVSEGDTLNYTLIVTDSTGASAVKYATVPPGWANFALAASRRGAAFGGIPHGTAEKPMLESWYPLHMYEAIYDRSNTEVIGAKMIKVVKSKNITVPNSSDVTPELFTAEEAGLYIVSLSTGWAADADGVRATSIYRMVDGTRLLLASSRMVAGVSASLHQNVCALVYANAGETIYGLMWKNGGNANDAYYYYQVAKIGK